jgi:hypothetical protein
MGQLGKYKKGQAMASLFHFAWYKRPQSDAAIYELPLDRATEKGQPTENLSDLLGRVSENSTSQIDNLVGEFDRLRLKLQTDGERIQREIEEYNTLSQQVMELTKNLSGSVEKVRASVEQADA